MGAVMLLRRDSARRTAHEAAIQRRFGGKRRRRRVLPRQISPKAVAVQYAKELRALMQMVAQVYGPLLDAIRGVVRTDALPPRAKATYTPTRLVKPLSGLKRSTYTPTHLVTSTKPTRGLTGYTPTAVRETVRLSARDAKRLLDEAKTHLENAASTAQVESLANKFATRTATHQREQLGRQVRAALGADPFVRDPVLAGVTEDFVAQNVSLIKRIPTRLHEKIEGLVMNSVGTSQLNVDLASEIQKQFGVSERHATLIARDQISKYYGAVNRARQQELGVRRFIWRTVNDERVRDEHAELEGKEFSWSDLPTNKKGEPIYPGSEIQCRCTAEPIMDDILDELDALEADTEVPVVPEDEPEVDQDEEE